MLALDLVDKGLVTDQIVLTVGYDIENLTNPERRKMYRGAVTTDNYGRKIPKHAHGTTNLERYTSSSRLMTDAVEKYNQAHTPDAPQVLLNHRISPQKHGQELSANVLH